MQGGQAMSFESILYEKKDRVVIITLNRPEVLNAFLPSMGQEMLQAFHQAEDDEDVGCVVLTGAGRGFCSGADVREFQAGLEGRRADQALSAATEAQACCEANRESMERMFQKSMSK